MKNMVVLVDTNVVLDFLAQREPHFQEADALMEKCGKREIDGYIAFHSLSIIWYVLRKMPEKERRECLLNVCSLLHVAGASHDSVVDAIKDDAFHDFEDCLQSKCAEEIMADYIVTQNVKDYQESVIPAMTPSDILKVS